MKKVFALFLCMFVAHLVAMTAETQKFAKSLNEVTLMQPEPALPDIATALTESNSSTSAAVDFRCSIAVASSVPSAGLMDDIPAGGFNFVTTAAALTPMGEVLLE